MTTYRSAPLSFTKIDCFSTCAWRYCCKYLQKLPDPSGPPAEVGTGFHAWAEVAAGLDDELAMVRALEEKAALLLDGPAEDLRMVVHRYLNAGGIPKLPTDATDVRREAELAIRADGSPCGYWDDDALFRGKLDLTWLENGGELAVVRDWKTSRVIVDPGRQLRLYATLLAALHEDVETVIGEQHFVRFAPGGCRKAEYDADELRAIVPASLVAIANEIDARVEARDLKPRISESCSWCPYRQHCPPIKAGYKPDLRFETPEAVAEAADGLLVLELQVKDLKAALRAWVLHHGGVKLAGGEVLDHHPTQTRSIEDAKAAAALLQQLGASSDALWSALELPVGAAEKVIRTLPEVSGAGRGRKTEAAQRVLAQLSEAGVLKSSLGTRFGRKKPNAEEIDGGES